MKSSSLVFYELMKYPIPNHEEYFYYIEPKITQTNEIKSVSWNKTNNYHEEYLEEIKKNIRLFKSLPWVEELYLCNSLTFNALHETSDIDLLIITTPGRLWWCRLFSILFFTIGGIRRRGNQKRKKFCLSFYLTKDHQNLYSISLKQGDIYLVYRLAHLVPLYKKTKSYQPAIFSSNKRIQNFLPNHPLRPIIDIGVTCTWGDTRLKKTCEQLTKGRIGNWSESMIKTLRVPYILWKKKKLGVQGRGIIITDTMLKFHGDIRKKIATLYEFHTNKKIK